MVGESTFASQSLRSEPHPGRESRMNSQRTPELAHIDARTILLLSVTKTTATIEGLNESDLKSAGELLLRFMAAAPTVHSRSPGAKKISGSQTVLRRFEFTAKTGGHFSSDGDGPGLAMNVG